MRGRWILHATLSAALLSITVNGSAAAQDRYAAVAIDAVSGSVLFQDNPDAPHFPASLAKMMTLYLLFDAIRRGEIRREDMLTASAAAAAKPSTHLGLHEGDQISVEDAIRAIAVWSANDVATMIAERLGGSEENFAVMMTTRARALGLANTRFSNATGLPDPTETTTARDMAWLGRALWADFPEFYSYFQTADFTWDSQRVRNHNHLLGQVDGVDGIKTGFTRDSGFNIVLSAYRNGRRVIVVVMGGDSAADRDAQAAYLVDSAFDVVTHGASASVADAAVHTVSQRAP